jgi:hypothetical protein
MMSNQRSAQRILLGPWTAPDTTDITLSVAGG